MISCAGTAVVEATRGVARGSCGRRWRALQVRQDEAAPRRLGGNPRRATVAPLRYKVVRHVRVCVMICMRFYVIHQSLCDPNPYSSVMSGFGGFRGVVRQDGVLGRGGGQG